MNEETQANTGVSGFSLSHNEVMRNELIPKKRQFKNNRNKNILTETIRWLYFNIFHTHRWTHLYLTAFIYFFEVAFSVHGNYIFLICVAE